MKKENEHESVTIRLNGVPPVKQPGMSGAQENTKRRKKLRDEAVRIAKETNRAYEFYGDTKLKLTIVYRRCRGKIDSANIVGGIADALQGTFYEDDRQLVQIEYREETHKKRYYYEIILEKII